MKTGSSERKKRGPNLKEVRKKESKREVEELVQDSV